VYNIYSLRRWSPRPRTTSPVGTSPLPENWYNLSFIIHNIINYNISYCENYEAFSQWDDDDYDCEIIHDDMDFIIVLLVLLLSVRWVTTTVWWHLLSRLLTAFLGSYHKILLYFFILLWYYWFWKKMYYGFHFLVNLANLKYR